MRNRIVRTICTVALGYALALLPLICSADDKDGKPKPADTSRPPDWSSYSTVADVVGEVVKADDKSITLRVTWYVPQAKGGGGNNNNNRRPQLSKNNQNYRNPYARNGNRPRGTQVNYKEEHHDYDLEFVPQSLVRTRSLPPKFDDNGKRVFHDQKEIDTLRLPLGVTGYAASTYDLTPGAIVEVIIIREKSIPASKATEDDLRVKYAIVLGKNPNPPKDSTDSKDDRKAKVKGKKDKN